MKSPLGSFYFNACKWLKLTKILIVALLGMVTNIPATMVTDQFGMIGLLTFIRAAETDPNLVSLALGTDLTTLGLNLNSDVSDLFGS